MSLIPVDDSIAIELPISVVPRVGELYGPIPLPMYKVHQQNAFVKIINHMNHLENSRLTRNQITRNFNVEDAFNNLGTRPIEDGSPEFFELKYLKSYINHSTRKYELEDYCKLKFLENSNTLNFVYNIRDSKNKLIDWTDLKFRNLEDNPNDDDDFNDGHGDGGIESGGGAFDDIDGNNDEILITGAGKCLIFHFYSMIHLLYVLLIMTAYYLQVTTLHS